MIRLILIDNPHDIKTIDLKNQLNNLGLTDETHVIPFDEASKVLPIQAAPSVFLLGTEDLLSSTTGEVVKSLVDFIRDKSSIESNMEYLGNIAVQARKVGIK